MAAPGVGEGSVFLENNTLVQMLCSRTFFTKTKPKSSHSACQDELICNMQTLDGTLNTVTKGNGGSFFGYFSVPTIVISTCISCSLGVGDLPDLST